MPPELPADDPVVRLQLYVAGASPRSGSAESSLRRLGDEALEGRYELEVIDVTADPDRAEAARILTTPTVVKSHPLPQRRVTGDLTRGPEVLAALVPDRSRGASRPSPSEAP